jgi:CRISPR-associated endonuclease Csn1
MRGDAIFQLPHDGKEVVATLETNDMFLLGLSNEEFEDNRNNYAFLSMYLYRVQKMSSMFYTFRFHLASSIKNKNEEVYFQSFAAWQFANPIKVKITNLGIINLEY